MTGVPRLEGHIITLGGLVSPSLCQMIIDEYNGDQFEEAVVGVDNDTDKRLNTEVRNCSQLPINGEVQSRNLRVRTFIEKTIGEVMHTAAGCYLKMHPACPGPKQDTGYIVLKYTKGQHYGQHIDNVEHGRQLSISIALNDDYTGGEWGFFDKSLRIRLKTGDAVMFPSNWMFPHEILPIEDGVRYSLITWFR